MRISENALLVFETDDDTKFMHTGMDPDYKVRGHYLNTLGIVLLRMTGTDLLSFLFLGITIDLLKIFFIPYSLMQVF
jgi:hypothetical protein